MVKKLKESIYAAIVTVGMIVVYKLSDVNYIRWSLVSMYSFAAIVFAEIILKEEPGEFLNLFSIENWKKAKISSVLMVIVTISFIIAFYSFYKAIINTKW